MPDDEAHPALPYQSLATAEAENLIAHGARVIDVRWPEEWQQGHIAGATLLPLSGIYAFGRALQDLHLAVDEEVIFVCAAGQRSAVAAEIAALLGLRKVYNLVHGMQGWRASGCPVERERH
jgi:rhodanese-related sulfurtransferase